MFSSETGTDAAGMKTGTAVLDKAVVKTATEDETWTAAGLNASEVESGTAAGMKAAEEDTCCGKREQWSSVVLHC